MPSHAKVELEKSTVVDIMLGAIQADKDDNANRNLDVSQHRCTSTIQQYCQGFVNGYNDEAGFLK